MFMCDASGAGGWIFVWFLDVRLGCVCGVLESFGVLP